MSLFKPFKKLEEKKCVITDGSRPYQTKFSFGVTSGIITNLSLITGMNSWQHAKASIISSILVIALADNISDSLGIHIYQESECIGIKEAWFSTFTNFAWRFLVSMTFIFMVMVLPMAAAVACSVAWGLALLAVLSYIISKARGVSPWQAMIEHISIAVLVISLSHFVGKAIVARFPV